MQHGFDSHRTRDVSRDRTLNEMGYRVLRFGNPEIDRNIDGVLEFNPIGANCRCGPNREHAMKVKKRIVKYTNNNAVETPRRGSN